MRGFEELFLVVCNILSDCICLVLLVAVLLHSFIHVSFHLYIYCDFETKNHVLFVSVTAQGNQIHVCVCLAISTYFLPFMSINTCT